MKNYIIVTGGAGFVGSNLIADLLNKTKFNIISIDNYSSGHKRNHIKSKRVKYLRGHTKNISQLLKNYKSKTNSIFHFGEFARIYQSFLQMNECIQSNTIGTNAVFYNVYGPNQITKGKMATVIGIFEDHYLNKKPLPVVKPGTQSRRFTHVQDTIDICFKAWQKDMCKYYSISNKKSYSIVKVAKLFNSKIKYFPERKGERYASALTSMSLSNKVYKSFGKIDLKDYVMNFLKTHKKNK